jgi:hypothetical protein
MAINYHNNEVSGFIKIGSKSFSIVPLDNNRQFLLEHNNEVYHSCGQPEDTTSTPDPPSGPSECGETPPEIIQDNSCAATISVLLVITNEAKDWILSNNGSINAFAMEGQNAVNLAFLNSNIHNKEVIVRWVERDLSGALSPNNNIGDDWLQLPTLLSSDRTAQLADIAFLITNQGYDGIAGIASGIGPSPDFAYGIVEAPYFNTQLVFAHELGHLLGGRHNWPKNVGDDPTEVFHHAFRQVFPPDPIDYNDVNIVGTWMTIVGRPVPVGGVFLLDDGNGNEYLADFVGDHRILHYSNPDVVYNNWAVTGTECANNALKIQNSACELDDFMASQELDVFITNGGIPCSLPITYTATIIPPTQGLQGQGPYTVTWTGGSFFNFPNGGVFLGTGPTLTLTTHLHCPYYWLNCVVTSSDGITTSTTRQILVDVSCCTTEGESDTNGDGERVLTQDINTFSPKIQLSPNPTNNMRVEISLDATMTVPFGYKLSTLEGRLLDAGQSVIENGKATLTFADEIPGLYLLQLNLSTGTTKTFKLIILK